MTIEFNKHAFNYACSTLDSSNDVYSIEIIKHLLKDYCFVSCNQSGICIKDLEYQNCIGNCSKLHPIVDDSILHHNHSIKDPLNSISKQNILISRDQILLSLDLRCPNVIELTKTFQNDIINCIDVFDDNYFMFGDCDGQVLVADSRSLDQPLFTIQEKNDICVGCRFLSSPSIILNGFVLFIVDL